MVKQSTISDLERYDEKVRAIVRKHGLTCFDQEFIVCSHDDMISYLAYHGIPAHYGHWSYGQQYAIEKTKHQYGVTGLPYEIVINTDPSMAYLMRDNSLALNVLILAHVYGHTDFFKNNLMFKNTNPKFAVERFALHAERIRNYQQDPSIGYKMVEDTLDACHALSLSCRRYLAEPRLTRQEQEARVREKFIKRNPASYARHELDEAGYRAALKKNPIEPDEDILLFIRDNNSLLTDWQKDIIDIVREESDYFLPQMETKIMNEGWASYWHYTIMNELNSAGDLSHELHYEFIRQHNEVVKPIPGRLNPYYLGFKVWEDIVRWHDAPTKKDVELYGQPRQTSREALLSIRETERDVSFLRQYLSHDLMRELDMIEIEFEETESTETASISEVSDEDGWEKVKNTLLSNIGVESIPVIKVTDANYSKNGWLYLKHEPDGRELDIDNTKRTLAFVFELWKKKIVLETSYDQDGVQIPVRLTYNNKDGFETKVIDPKASS